MNPASTRLLGWAEDEMLGLSLGDFLHPDDLSSTRGELGKLAGGALVAATTASLPALPAFCASSLIRFDFHARG